MPRRQIQVEVADTKWRQSFGMDSMSSGDLFTDLGMEGMSEVSVVAQLYLPEREVQVLICQHDSYDEVQDYEAAPTFRWDDPAIIPPAPEVPTPPVPEPPTPEEPPKEDGA